MPEIQVKEAIVRCDFNAELALNTLLNNPGAYKNCDEDRRRTRGGQQPRPTNLSPPPIPATPSLPGSANTESDPLNLFQSSVFSTKSFSSATEQQSKFERSSSPFNEAAPPVFATPMSVSRAEKSVPTNLNLSTKPQSKRLEIRSRTPSPGNITPNTSQVGFKYSRKNFFSSFVPKNLYRNRQKKIVIKCLHFFSL